MTTVHRPEIAVSLHSSVAVTCRGAPLSPTQESGARIAGCATAAVEAQPIGSINGRREYAVGCKDNYDFCTAAENKVCPQGYSYISYSDQVPIVSRNQTWDFQFVCKSSRE